MKLVMPIAEIDALHAKAERDHLLAHGFLRDEPILRLEHRGFIHTDLEFVEFQQDDTPDKGGDNIAVEYLKSQTG